MANHNTNTLIDYKILREEIFQLNPHIRKLFQDKAKEESSEFHSQDKIIIYAGSQEQLKPK